MRNPDFPAESIRPSAAHAWRDALLALLAYVAITVVMFWPVVRHIADSFPNDLGDPPNESWLVAWTVHALTTAP
jgi:ABC-type sugar transport system permease subunit